MNTRYRVRPAIATRGCGCRAVLSEVCFVVALACIMVVFVGSVWLAKIGGWLGRLAAWMGR